MQHLPCPSRRTSLPLAFLLVGCGEIAPSRFEEVERLDVNHALWGRDVGNAAKALGVVYDAPTDTVITTGLSSDRLVFTRPREGVPFADLDLRTPAGWGPAVMAHDEARRRLFWMSQEDCTLRVVDLDRREVVAGLEQGCWARGEASRTRPQVALDPTTGWIWVLGGAAGGLVGYGPDLVASRPVPEVGTAVQATITSRGEFYVLTSPAQEVSGLLRFTPSTGAVEELDRWERRRDGGPVRRDAGGTEGAAEGERTSRGRPPRDLHALEDGRLLLVNRGLAVVTADLRPSWRSRLPSDPADVVAQDDLVFVSLPDGDEEAAGPGGLVAVLDAATGRERARLAVGYEARRLALDPAGERLFVANGGDGSVDVFDLRTMEQTARLDVANAPDQIVLDPRSGDRYLLDRLGGSEVYRWRKAETTLERWPAGVWPGRLVLDGKRHVLLALSWLAPRLHVLDPARGGAREDLDLDITPGRAPPVMAWDEDRGAGIFADPEGGRVLAWDLASRKVRWSTEVAGLRGSLEEGSAGVSVALDPARGRAYVATRSPHLLRVLDLESGAAVAEAPLIDAADAGTRREAQRTLAEEIVVDPAGDRIFVGAFVVDREALRVVGTLPDADRVVHADRERVLALALDSRRTDTLLHLDPGSLKVRDWWDLGQGTRLGRSATWDPATHRVYVVDPAEAEVVVYTVPGP